MTDHHKPIYTGETLLHAVYGYWAASFGCGPDLFDSPGTTIFPRESLRGEGMIYFYRMGKHAVLRMDSVLIPRLEQLVARTGPSVTLTPDDLEAFFGEAHFGFEDIYPHFYLDPADFVPAAEPEDVPVRRLAQSEYHRLDAYFGACSEQDLDDAEIWLDKPDPVIFCGFQDDRIIAYASHRYWEDLIADIGVLTHPEFRGRGLGRAAVSALTRWCVDHDKIPQYRVDQGHVHSRRIPESLGYTRLFDVIPVEIS